MVLHLLPSGTSQFLDPGNHTLTVTDASDKSVSTIINLKNTFDRPKAELSLFDRPSGCSANDGKITIKTTGGTPPYTYSLDRFTWQTDNTFKNLHSNWFFYMVKDANGCETTANNGPL